MTKVKKVLQLEELKKFIATCISADDWPADAKYARVLKGEHCHSLFVDLFSSRQAALNASLSKGMRVPVKLQEGVIIEGDHYLSKKAIYQQLPSEKRLAGADGVDRGEKYRRRIKGVDCDIYDITTAYDVTCGAVQHALKKLLLPGGRGPKSRLSDLQEAMRSVERAIELEEAKTVTTP